MGIFIGKMNDATLFPYMTWVKDKTCSQIFYTKYNIKETDMRVKTATFTSPEFFDLTTSVFVVLISSKWHENFSGRILDVEYDEETGLYTYQCQDWSRTYINKFEYIGNNVSVYNLLQYLITKGRMSNKFNPTKNDLKLFKNVLSGLRPLELYDQSLYDGNMWKGNPFKQKANVIIRDKTFIEVIRGIVYSSLGYFDVWFAESGALQIEPISKKDWENTGLVLSDSEYYNRKFKFNTTNVITKVLVSGSDFTLGSKYESKDLLGLDLSVFFGDYSTTISDPTKNNTKAVKSNNTTKNTTNKNGNPYNNKAKKVWINADNGSNDMKNSLISALKNDGWTVHDGGTGSNNHYSGYFDVSSDYSVYITLYNGFCAGTIQEAYSSRIQNELKRKGVQLVPIWDSSGWTNPNGMKPYRYGDFSGYRASRAWDDNFSSSDPTISNVGDFMKRNKATYCVSPSASEIMQQFKAGGYFKYKGINV